MEIITFDAVELDATEFAEGKTADGVPYIDRSGPLFRAGQHKGRKWTTADLDKVVTQ